MYLTENKSVHDIATVFNTTGTTIAATLRRNKISVKLTNGKFTKKQPKYNYQTLYTLYIIKKLSSYEIANLLNYQHHSDIIEDLKFYNIPRRSYIEADKILYEKHPEKKELFRKYFYEGVTGPTSNKMTSLEKIFVDWANEHKITFTHQFQLRSTWHRYDFRINNTQLIVEMDGDFWHSLPEHIERDKKFDETANRHGFVVIRIKESDIKNDSQILNKKIFPLLKKEENIL